MTVLTRLISNCFFISLLTSCANYYEIPVETPLQPKLDISDFQRVMIAGFVTGGSDEIDTNLETARLLRSQLRNSSEFQIVDADVIDLTSVAAEQGDEILFSDTANNNTQTEGDASFPGDTDQENSNENLGYSEDDLELLEQIFADTSYWRQLGEEFQEPLIITGTVYFTPHERSGMVTRTREIYDEFGRRQVAPVRAYRDRRGYILSPKFIFIDGRTGATLYTERHREEILYDASQNSPALSSYFELMDRLIPSFLGTLSAETIKGTRILLK
ncbi:MAG: hypothetical protein CMM58_13740 [Rhodospirillaceae bacterium]|mgnify:CR=1 FL=1|nr:hypothetical protein [Rhodospirillaceae bacterium]|tara:strand:+ start:3304 stop:4122 length:819 start_codon:yes stop_codon:yes gene_type:complete